MDEQRDEKGEPPREKDGIEKCHAAKSARSRRKAGDTRWCAWGDSRTSAIMLAL
jgi:hypothetical protein